MGRVLENGYELQTTFWEDFSVADEFDDDAILDTFKCAFKNWKNNLVYVTELTMVMSWKSCSWYDKNQERSFLYAKLYRVADEWCLKHFKGKDLEYYLKTTD